MLLIKNMAFIIRGDEMDEDLSNLLRNSEMAIVLTIKEEKNIIILVHKSKCDKCWDIKKTLLKHILFYDTVNSDNDKRYQSILKKLELSDKDIVEPTIINVEKGKVVSLLVDIKNVDDLEEFLEYNNLTN